MALKKSKILSTGHTSEYWHIMGGNLSINGGIYLNVQIALYKDRTQYLSGGGASEVIGLQLKNKVPNAIAVALRDWIYTQIKNGNYDLPNGINYFADAVDEID